jgi:hypothetical protein
MSCKCEIILQKFDSVLSVPIQAVSTVDGQTVVWGKGEAGLQKKPVKVGPNNDRFVAILDGLNEGDEVSLLPPASAAKTSVLDRPSEKPDAEGVIKTSDEEPAADETAVPQRNLDAAPVGGDRGGSPDGVAPDQRRAPGASGAPGGRPGGGRPSGGGGGGGGLRSDSGAAPAATTAEAKGAPTAS